MVVLGVLGSFMGQVLVRAGHHHELQVHEVAGHAEHEAAGSGCGHHRHGGEGSQREHQHRDGDGPCDVCLKLTLAKFTSMVGGSVSGLVLPLMVVVTVEIDAPASHAAASVWRATSRGPPTLA